MGQMRNLSFDKWDTRHAMPRAMTAAGEALFASAFDVDFIPFHRAICLGSRNPVVSHARTGFALISTERFLMRFRKFRQCEEKTARDRRAVENCIGERFECGRNFPISSSSARVFCKISRSAFRPNSIIGHRRFSGMEPLLQRRESFLPPKVGSISRRGGMSGVSRQQIVLTGKEIVFPIRLVCSPATAR